MLATSSAISGTLFGASRQMSVIAKEGYFPRILAKRTNNIPVWAIISMASFAFGLVLIGNLELILEFGSVTFLLVSLLMAYANFKIRHLTDSSSLMTITAMVGLSMGAGFILYYEFTTQLHQMFIIAGLYLVLTLAAWLYSREKIDAVRGT